MRQGNPGRRPRGRHNGNGAQGRNRSPGSLRHQTFDSNGPGVRVRGNAWQVHEKYQALAHDARSSGDMIMAENLLQHAEHYYRVIEAINEATGNNNDRGRSQQQQKRQPKNREPQSQPDMPSNYYTPDGKLAASQEGEGKEEKKEAPAKGRRRPPARRAKPEEGEAKKSDPFLTADDENDEGDDTPQKLAIGG